MSKSKRPVIKGRGADIFLANDNPETANQQAVIPAYQHTSTAAHQPTGKATFYLDEQILTSLDDLWLRLRRINKETTKSGIVNEILGQGITDKLKQIEGKG